MPEETQINLKFRLTVGSFLLWLSFFLPFILINVAQSVQQLQLAFTMPLGLAFAGFVISWLQDSQSKTPFSAGRVIFVLSMLIVVVIVTPVFMSAMVARR